MDFFKACHSQSDYKTKALPFAELLSSLRSEEPIPGRLLPSRAYFRFGSTQQISNPNSIFTTCRKKQPRSEESRFDFQIQQTEYTDCCFSYSCVFINGGEKFFVEISYDHTWLSTMAPDNLIDDLNVRKLYYKIIGREEGMIEINEKKRIGMMEFPNVEKLISFSDVHRHCTDFQASPNCPDYQVPMSVEVNKTMKKVIIRESGRITMEFNYDSYSYQNNIDGKTMLFIDGWKGETKYTLVFTEDINDVTLLAITIGNPKAQTYTFNVYQYSF
jgi:hypothetical protein